MRSITATVSLPEVKLSESHSSCLFLNLPSFGAKVTYASMLWGHEKLWCFGKLICAKNTWKFPASYETRGTQAWAHGLFPRKAISEVTHWKIIVI